MLDPKNDLTYTHLILPKSQNNATGDGGLDLRNYVGNLAVAVGVGAKTAGDTGSTIAVRLATSADANISNAVNVTVSSNNVTSAASTGSTLDILQLDLRSCNRYLYAVPTITGLNTPAFPLTVTTIGKKRVQP